MQAVHQGAGPGMQPAELVRAAQVHRQSGGPAILPGQDASLSTGFTVHSKS